MRNQKGITLVALVVTIVVLLILAGVSLAMLTGENGIITNAQKAKAANEESEVVEKMGLAYSTAKSEAMVQMALKTGYQPSAAASATALANVVAKELGVSVTAGEPSTTDAVTNGYNVYLTEDDDSTTTSPKYTITMIYGSPKFGLINTASLTDGIYPNKIGEISLTTTGVQYTTQATRIVE